MEWSRGVPIMVITLARPDDSMQALVDRADQLMFQSKQNGRNRVSA